ncbi:MAG TPA: hypothetical protein VMT87_10840 [Vicinamibacteria bacterium]|nr:hypothetical protein [Vicinamibacteria bacterium]
MTTRDKTIFDELKARGEEFFTRMSGELMSNPNFTRAMQAAWWGKEKVDQAVAQALRGMRIPTRDEFHRVLRRLEALEAEVDRLKLAQRGPARASNRGPGGAAASAARAKSARRPRAPRKGGGTTPAED